VRALVADDDRGTALVLKSILETRGLEVVVVHDGSDAWNRLRTDKSIVMSIFDWMMPGVDGPELIRRVRKDETHDAMYVLLLTARDKTADLVEGLSAGADDYVKKPINVEELRARIDVGLRVLMLQGRLADRVAELNQAQKLESVGRLAAGVAHEINTPVQFVSDSVHFIRDAVTDLEKLIGHYKAAIAEIAAGGNTAAVQSAVVKAESDSDLPYLLEHLPRAVERSLEGLERVTTIVRSMKEFAHPDRKEMIAVDLNQALRSTLTISRHEYKYVADVDTDFGDIPIVTCHAGDVNQATLNIFVNAAHAIGDVVKDSGAKGRIGVTTCQDGDFVVIRISDTGSGIPKGIRDRIFDPFFTTKDVGRGTGQGLAIARSIIVEKHRGELTFETEEGKGTTFFIRLPINGGSEAGLAA
jgi:signal transduction histidine kinase